MNNKKVDQRKRDEENKIREGLEKLLQQDERELSVLTAEVQSLLPSKNNTFMDYHSVKTSSDLAAREIIDAISEFYLDTDFIERISYVKQKTNVDKITVSNLLFQMKTAEHAIIKLLEEIDGGNLHPRTFEVLASLQRSKMEIVKHLAQFMIIMEGNYKNLRDDYRFKKSENGLDGEIQVEQAESNKFRCTRQIIETLRESIPEARTNEKELKKDGDDGESLDK
jgi:hypothetical protein